MRRMARAALGLGIRELAAAAKVSIDTVARFERGDELKERTIDALQRHSRQPVSSSPMAISLASALRGLLPRALQKPPQRPNRRLPRKQSAAKLPMRPRKNDRMPASRVALGDRWAQMGI
jgi:transcriptional regulator with XRE-family HTH domain